MAKHNLVYLYGQVIAAPKIMTDEDGNLKRGYCVIKIIRGIRDAGDKDRIKNLRYDCPVIMTDNPEKLQIMSELKKDDMVEVKGAICTKEVKKKTRCPKCGEVHTVDGNVVSVYPIYLHKREHANNDEEGMEFLKENCEISNQATVIGTLCREPQGYRCDKGLYITQYQLAINRKFHIKEDPVDVKTDYPWIKSYGTIAENDSRALHTGSVVFVDGRIQTREVQRTSKCESCGTTYPWKDSALEVVPYAVEYLKNYISMEESMAMEEDQAQKSLEKALGIRDESEIDEIVENEKRKEQMKELAKKTAAILEDNIAAAGTEAKKPVKKVKSTKPENKPQIQKSDVTNSKKRRQQDA